jgi:hypothetical protein
MVTLLFYIFFVLLLFVGEMDEAGNSQHTRETVYAAMIPQLS